MTPPVYPAGSGMRLLVEDSAAPRPAEQMYDTGDGRRFACGGGRFSLCRADENGEDRRPVVMPDGVRHGGLASPSASGGPDTLDVEGGSAFVSGSVVAFSPVSGLALSRPAPPSVWIASVALDASGTVHAVYGAEGGAFSEERGAPGGPPFVASGAVELATVRLASASTPIAAEDVGFAPEMAHAPAFRLLPFSAMVEFAAPLDPIHENGATRGVWISWSEPAMSELEFFSVTPPESSFFIDHAKGETWEGVPAPGTLSIPLSGDPASLSRRIAGTVRLMEFMPYGSGGMKRSFYAAVEGGAAGDPGAPVEGRFTLKPVVSPLDEPA